MSFLCILYIEGRDPVYNDSIQRKGGEIVLNMSIDEEIIKLFWNRDEKALEEFERHYRALCLKVANNITDNPEDAQECLNDLYLCLWNTIPPKQPISLKSYSCEIIRNFALQSVRKRNAKKRHGVIEELSEVVQDIPYYDDNEITDAINQFLLKQTKLNAIIFVRRYFYSEPVKDISVKTGLKENKISKILTKQRKSLREELKKGGIHV